MAERDQAQIARILSEYGKARQAETEPEKQPDKGQAKQAEAGKGGGLADGAKDLEAAIWGDNPAPIGAEGGWAAENAADTIDRALGGGDGAKSIDNLLAKFGRGKSEPNQDKTRANEPKQAKAKEFEPGA